MDRNQLFVHVYLSKENALANGETRSGNLAIRLTSALLDALSSEERKDLAISCDQENAKIYYANYLTVTGLSTEAIIAAVRARRAAAVAKLEAEAAKRAAIEALMAGPVETRLTCDTTRKPGDRWSVSQAARELIGYGTEANTIESEAAERNAQAVIGEDGHLLDLPVDQHVAQYGPGTAYPGQWHVTVDARYTRAHKRALAEAEFRNAAREAALLAEFETVLKPALTAEQWERYHAHVLPSDERDDAMRRVLFDGVSLPVYVAVLPTEVDHTEECERNGSVNFKTKDFDALSSLNHLTADEFAAVKRVLAVYAEHPRLVSITYRLHTGECKECEETTEKIGVRIRLGVGGRVYSREYAIT